MLHDRVLSFQRALVNRENPVTMLQKSSAMKTTIRRPLLAIMWTSIGLGVVAGALYLGNELRKQRLGIRNPYESYSHAGEDRIFDGGEYGVGI